MNVLLGGEGMIGRALRRRLEAAGEAVVVYDLRSGHDLRDWVPPAPRGEAFYWFLAWDVGGAKYLLDPDVQRASLEHNVALSQRVFGVLAERRARFLYAGTQMAGFSNAYGHTKAMAQYWAALLGGQNAVLWNVFGATAIGPRSHVIPDLIDQGVRGRIQLRSQGVERRQFLYVDDCAAALIAQRQLGLPEAHITSGEWVSILEVAHAVADLTGATVSAGGAPGYEHLVEPTRPLAGWTPAHSLREGLRLTYAQMQAAGWCDGPPSE